MKQQNCVDIALANPLKTRAIAEAKIKSDKLDATILADLARADLVARCYVPDKDSRDVSALVRYRIDPAKVEENGRGRYIVSEPPLIEEEQRIYSLIIESLYYSLKPVARIEEPIKYIESYIWEASEELGIVEQVEKAYPKYKYYIARDALGYGLINVPMKDPDVK